MNFIEGVRAFSDGAGQARDPRLRRYIWLPALLSLAIISLGLWFALGYLGNLSDAFINWLPNWLRFLDAVLIPLLYLLAILIGAWVYALLAVLIASPFLGVFSSAVEHKVWGTGPTDDASLWHGIISSLAREGRKLLYYLPRLIVVVVFTLLPVINVASPFIWFLFGSWVLAVQFCDYPMENRLRPFSDTLQRLKQQRLAALGFGACATLTMAIPLLNFVFIPVAVAGGTLLMRRIDPAL